MSQPPPPSTPVASTTYPYGSYPSAYPAAYPQTPGAYPYQPAGTYQYGWNYSPYNYATPTQPRTSAAPQVASTSARTSTPNPPQRSSTFSAYTPSQSIAAAATGGATGRASRKQASVRGLFTKDLRHLMYAFGDVEHPDADTTAVMEEILIEYITDVCQRATAESKRVRLSIEDLRRALSAPADSKKLARMEELLFMQETIKRARAVFEDSDVRHPKEF